MSKCVTTTDSVDEVKQVAIGEKSKSGKGIRIY